jgi:hypothetical protein
VNSRRSWLIWGVAVFAYMVAVMQRTSLGVSGIEAAHRFDVSASVLSSLAVVQLMVYAALQIPTGVLLDRVGPKALITVGAVLMLAGQITLAVAPSIGVAILGRILVGAGDALTFISVIRLLASWFRGRLLPQVSQWTGNIGQLGQVLSAIPLSVLLHQYGWTPAFLSAAALSLLAAVLVGVLLSNGQPTARTTDAAAADRAATWRAASRQLRESLARPGTQLGFWSHFVTQSSGTVFSLLWGRARVFTGNGIRAPHPHRRGRGGQRADPRHPHRSLPDAPVEPRDRDRVVDRNHLDHGAGLAGASAILARRDARGRARDRRSRVTHRVRLRPHLQSDAESRLGERSRQCRRLPGELRDDVPDWSRSRPAGRGADRRGSRERCLCLGFVSIRTARAVPRDRRWDDVSCSGTAAHAPTPARGRRNRSGPVVGFSRQILESPQ